MNEMALPAIIDAKPAKPVELGAPEKTKKVRPPRKRKIHLVPSAIKYRALNLNLRVETPEPAFMSFDKELPPLTVLPETRRIQIDAFFESEMKSLARWMSMNNRALQKTLVKIMLHVNRENYERSGKIIFRIVDDAAPETLSAAGYQLALIPDEIMIERPQKGSLILMRQRVGGEDGAMRDILGVSVEGFFIPINLTGKNIQLIGGWVGEKIRAAWALGARDIAVHRATPLRLQHEREQNAEAEQEAREAHDNAPPASRAKPRARAVRPLSVQAKVELNNLQRLRALKRKKKDLAREVKSAWSTVEREKILVTRAKNATKKLKKRRKTHLLQIELRAARDAKFAASLVTVKGLKKQNNARLLYKLDLDAAQKKVDNAIARRKSVLTIAKEKTRLLDQTNVELGRALATHASPAAIEPLFSGARCELLRLEVTHTIFAEFSYAASANALRKTLAAVNAASAVVGIGDLVEPARLVSMERKKEHTAKQAIAAQAKAAEASKLVFKSAAAWMSYGYQHRGDAAHIAQARAAGDKSFRAALNRAKTEVMRTKNIWMSFEKISKPARVKKAAPPVQNQQPATQNAGISTPATPPKMRAVKAPGRTQAGRGEFDQTVASLFSVQQGTLTLPLQPPANMDSLRYGGRHTAGSYAWQSGIKVVHLPR
ncbi:MAG: hypothetical protein P4M15_09045 [Alphaproteobacteria bacterium]|nr:hypothetical protein [Alphaproteobacteria bacterium]